MDGEAMMHVFAHQRVRAAFDCGSQDLGVVKRQLVLLRYFKDFGVGGYRQGHYAACGFDGSEQSQGLGPAHLELAMANRGHFVEHLYADRWLLKQ